VEAEDSKKFDIDDLSAAEKGEASPLLRQDITKPEPCHMKNERLMNKDERGADID
jgi:hypothetical protein